VISILVADDHGVVRAGLRRLIDAELGLKVCGEACDGHEVLDQVERHHPDILILDLSMPGPSGLETLEELRRTHPKTRTIVLSFRSDPPIVQSAIALGADGYVLKSGRTDEILVAIREVMRGSCYFSPPVAREISTRTPEPGERAGDPFARLSTREREVLRLIAEGLSAKEIATRLFISAKTVEAHRTSVMRKLGARKATELVRYAVRHGLVEA
jgi:DNA-binding NarL/FixJ family response regulator